MIHMLIGEGMFGRRPSENGKVFGPKKEGHFKVRFDPVRGIFCHGVSFSFHDL